MLENYPLRSEILDTDYFTNYREDALIPEGVASWSVIKNNLLGGLMIKNNYYRVIQKVDIRVKLFPCICSEY